MKPKKKSSSKGRKRKSNRKTRNTGAKNEISIQNEQETSRHWTDAIAEQEVPNEKSNRDASLTNNSKADDNQSESAKADDNQSESTERANETSSITDAEHAPQQCIKDSNIDNVEVDKNGRGLHKDNTKTDVSQSESTVANERSSITDPEHRVHEHSEDCDHTPNNEKVEEVDKNGRRLHGKGSGEHENEEKNCDVFQNDGNNSHNLKSGGNKEKRGKGAILCKNGVTKGHEIVTGGSESSAGCIDDGHGDSTINGNKIVSNIDVKLNHDKTTDGISEKATGEIDSSACEPIRNLIGAVDIHDVQDDNLSVIDINNEVNGDKTDNGGVSEEGTGENCKTVRGISGSQIVTQAKETTESLIGVRDMDDAQGDRTIKRLRSVSNMHGEVSRDKSATDGISENATGGSESSASKPVQNSVDAVDIHEVKDDRIVSNIDNEVSEDKTENHGNSNLNATSEKCDTVPGVSGSQMVEEAFEETTKSTAIPKIVTSVSESLSYTDIDGIDAGEKVNSSDVESSDNEDLPLAELKMLRSKSHDLKQVKNKTLEFSSDEENTLPATKVDGVTNIEKIIEKLDNNTDAETHCMSMEEYRLSHAQELFASVIHDEEVYIKETRNEVDPHLFSQSDTTATTTGASDCEKHSSDSEPEIVIRRKKKKSK